MDASFYDRDRNGSSAVVLRDHEGRTCGGTAKWYDHSMNALTTEARACLDGMLYAQGRGVRTLILETDCQVLVNLWDNRSTQKSEVDPLLYQLADLNRSFDDFRICNRLAHECAKLVSRGNPVDDWLLAPPGLRVIIDDDCNLAHG